MVIELSQRNLLTLLAQLELTGDGAIHVPGPDGTKHLILAVSDAEKYRDREPGPMPEQIECFIGHFRQALNLIKRTPNDDPPRSEYSMENYHQALGRLNRTPIVPKISNV